MIDQERVDAVVYGTIALDTFTFENDPTQDGDRAGGEAFNTASSLDSWNVRVLLAGTQVGDDSEGRRLSGLLSAPELAGILRWQVPSFPNGPIVTPSCAIHVDEFGERTMRGRGFAGAIAPLPLPESVYLSHPLFVCDPNLGKPAMVEALRAANAGCPVIAMDFMNHPEVVHSSHVLITAPDAMRRLGAVMPAAGPEDAVRNWVEQGGAEISILTCGARGGVAYSRRDGVVPFSAFVPVDRIVDTTGAGDTFRAGIVYGVLQGWSLPKMLAFASTAAGLHCTQHGGASRISLHRILAAMPAFAL